jgi:hypothetical protein
MSSTIKTWANKTLYERIVEKHDEVDTDYQKANANRDIVTQYFRSDELIDTDEKGQLRGKSIYNGAGPWYSRKLSTGFQGNLVSKSIDWLRYMFDDLKLKGHDKLDMTLQNIKEHMSAAYKKSNFYDVQPQFTHDGVTTGSPVMFGEEDWANQRTMWLPQHYKTVRLYRDRYNQDEGCIVANKEWTAKKIFDTFIGEDDTNFSKSRKKLSRAVLTAMEQGQWNEKFLVYRATFKVTDPIWDGVGPNAFVRPRGDWKWLSAFFLELTAAEKDKQDTPLNEDMGDFEKPFVSWHFDRKPWEISSRTPAFYALWDNLSLQQLDKNYGENVQYVNRPAMMALNSMAGRMRLGPEGEILVTSDEYDRPPKPIRDKVAGLDLNKDYLEMKDEALSRWFMNDVLTVFSDLAFNKNQPITAYQSSLINGEKTTLLSPAIETHSVYLEDIDERMVGREVRAGRGPFSPDEMANLADLIESIVGQIDRVGIRPVFVGKLARAQKVAQAIEPIVATMDIARPMMELNPQLVFAYDWWETQNHINEAMDFPQIGMKSKEDFDKAVAADNQQKAQAQQQLMAIEMAKASKNLQGPVDESSVLAAAGRAAV